MKLVLLFYVLFFVVNGYSLEVTDSCESKTTFTIEEPQHSGARSLWASLRLLSTQAEFVSPADTNTQKAGLCILNPTSLLFPNEALLATAPAMLVKDGPKVFVLFQKSYSLELPPWAYNEDVCLHQVSELNRTAEKYLAAPARKISYEFKENTYFLNLATQLFATTYEVKKVAGNYIVKIDESEYCVFSAISK